MQEGMLSRRPPPGSPEGSEDDDAKTRKPSSHLGSLAARLFNIRSENHYLGHPLAISLLLLLIIVAFLFALYLPRPAVRISSVSYTSLFSAGVDSLDSNFGSLGVPWCRSKLGKTVDWTSKDLLKGLEEFVPIYETRPIKNNVHGMGFDHSFGLWFMARWLEPDLIIESGAFKGHSTWVLRQAMPNKPIISLSPRHPEKYLKKEPAYVDRNCTYFSGKNFVDFGSVEWDNVLKKQGILDLSRVLVFFDDHQSELKRLKQALKAGFRHLIFEDNYDTGTGDHYSLRQICDQAYIRGGGHSCIRHSDEARIRKKRNMFWEKAVDIDDLCGKGDAWWGVRGEMRDDFNHSNKAITYEEHFQNGGFIESVLDVYWELPPIAGPSLTHQTRYDPGRAPDPIIEDGSFGLFQRLGLSKLETSVFNGYTQMAYVQISANS